MANLLVITGNTALKAAWSDGTVLGKTFRYQGEKMLDAFKDATSDYNVPFKPSTNAQGDYGIDSLFGIDMETGTTEDGKTYYDYWTQYYMKSGKWEQSTEMMNAIPTSEYKVFLVSYERSVF